MPKISTVNPDGTGDYPDVSFWALLESESDYGAPTELHLDGLFDLSILGLDLIGTWPNGLKITCADSSKAFNGIKRSLCGLTSTSEKGTIVNYGHDITLVGLEVYNTFGHLSYNNLVEGGSFDAINCLFEDNLSSY